MKSSDNRRTFLRAGAATTVGSALAASGISSAFATNYPPGELRQSLDVYRDGNDYRLRGRIDGKEYSASKYADEVLQSAIDKLNEGGEIMLQPGTFELHKQINLASNVSLRGSGPATSLVLAGGHDTGTALSAVNCDRVVVAALSIKSPKNNPKAVAGVLFDDCGDGTVQDVFCLGFDHGIMFTNRSFLCEIRGCKIADSRKSGIYLKKLTGQGRGGDFVPNLITNCIIYGGEKGVECENTIVLNIVACLVYQTKLPAFHIHSESNSVIISGSRTFQIQSDAVMVENSHELNISGNTFCWHEGHGIVLRNVNWGLVASNEIIDTGSFNIDDQETGGERLSYWIKAPQNLDSFKKNGLMLLKNTKGIAVTGNAIFNWGSGPAMQHAILEDDSCEANNFTGNNINFCDNGLTLNGKESAESNNVVAAKVPHRGGDSITQNRLHRFDVRLIERFIDAQR